MMTMMMRYSAIAAGLIGGVVLATGAIPASATSLAPAVLYTGENANVEEVRHRWDHRPGQNQGERYWQQKNDPEGEADLRFDGPAFGFGFGMTGRPSARYGLSVPRGHAPGTTGLNRRYGRVDR